MYSSESDVPTPSVLQGVLRKITERLAGELASPTDTAPGWSAFEWQLARAVAALHGVSPLLASRLKWDGPPGWESFLEAQRTHVAARQQHIEELLARLDACARAEQIAVVGLKGAALHALGLYRAGERPMADIDLLVQPQDSTRVARVLESLGFREYFANWKHRVFLPEIRETHADMGEHAQNYLKVEVHERIAEILPLRTTDVTECIFPPRPHPGLNAYSSNTALMVHLLIHAAGAMAYRSLRLLNLHDIALVSSRMSGADWDALVAHRGIAGEGPWWALPPLQMTARYYVAVAPANVLAALSNHCHRTLRYTSRYRSLSDVSFSYPWIEAFPGIGWSRSIAEVMQYAASRIRPGKEMLELRKVMLETHTPIAATPWGRLSQGQRMLRWMTSRQARADTMRAVRTALAQPH
jgi:hypothetical protein